MMTISCWNSDADVITCM